MAAILQRAGESGDPLRVGHRLTIGRDPNCDLPLAGDEAVSREHARIRRTPDGYLVEDLESRNGTVIERGDQVLRVAEPVALEPGDVLRIGAQRFVFTLTDEADEHDATELPTSTHVPVRTVETRTGARPAAPPPRPPAQMPAGPRNRAFLIAASLVVAIVAVVLALLLARLLG